MNSELVNLKVTFDVPFREEEPFIDLHKRVEAMCNTVALSEDMDKEVITNTDRDSAAILTSAYAADPEKTSRVVTHNRASKLPNATLVAVHHTLEEFSHQVVESASEIRHYVTNKLIEESTHPDPRIRVRSLELLGKISDVGLFVDKTEIKTVDATAEVLRERIRAKLLSVRTPEDVEDAEIVPIKKRGRPPGRVSDPDAIDVDAELVLRDD